MVLVCQAAGVAEPQQPCAAAKQPDEAEAARLTTLPPWELARKLSHGDGLTPANLPAFWSAVAAALPRMTSHDCAVLALGSALARATPPPALAAAFAAATQPLLPVATAAELAHILTGFAAWREAGLVRASPSSAWRAAFYAALLSVSRLGAKELQHALRAAARLKLRPPADVLAGLEARTTALGLRAFDCPQLAALLWSFARLFSPGAPSPAWLEGAAAETRRRAGKLGASEGAMVLHAFAEMRHRPSDAWFAALDAAASKTLSGAPPQALATSLWARAVLGSRPSQTWLDAWDDRAGALLLARRGAFSRQALALCAWAAACLQLYHALPALPRLWAALCDGLAADVAAAPAPACAPADLRACHEVWTLACAEAPGRLAQPPAELLRAGAAAWAAAQAPRLAPGASGCSRLHAAVALALRDGLRLRCARLLCPASGRLVDCALPPAGTLRIAVQVDGPALFTRNSWQPLGGTAMRDRALTLAGWRVVSVPFYELKGGPRARTAYLAARLADAARSYLREEQAAAFPYAP